MPGRSPRRHSPPPPPLISRHSPSRRRVHSPERIHSEMSDRGRDRREYRSGRRSRSPPQVQSFSPSLKRKMSPNMEKEMPRRTKLSRSPVSLRGGSEHRSYVPPEPDTHVVRTVSETTRFIDKEFEEQDRAVPQFRGPEGTVDFDINELKKFTIEIIRKPTSANEDSHFNRSIINPDNIVPVRRPGMRGSGHYSEQRRGMGSKHFPPPHWVPEDAFLNNHEGSKPLFSRTDVAPMSSNDRSLPPEEFRRVVNISSSRGSNEIDRSRERIKYSSGSFEDNHGHPPPPQHYREREHSPYDSRRHSPPREEYFENRSRLQERAGGSRDEYRGDEGKRIVERKYFDRHSYERESDLRSRINEKRDTRLEEREHPSKRYEMERERPRRSHEMDREALGRSSQQVGPGRGHEMERKRLIRSQEMERERPVRSHEMERERPGPSREVERERSGRSNEMQRSSRPGRPRDFEKEHIRGHEMERERPSRSHEMSRERPRHSPERERDRPSRSHHSPPSSSRERRRPGSMERSRERGRGDDWERESGSERRRRHSRERSDRPRDRSDHYEEKRHKPDDEKKVYKHYEEEFVPPSTRGRGGLAIRRGVPPGLRGRGMVRGIPRFPRGMMVPRGLPRPPPFMGVPRFPPRFFPPY